MKKIQGSIPERLDNLASTYRNQSQWKQAEELEVQVMETAIGAPAPVKQMMTGWPEARGGPVTRLKSDICLDGSGINAEILASISQGLYSRIVMINQYLMK